MRKEQIDILVKIYAQENISLKEAVENIPNIIKRFPALAEVFGGVK